MRSLERHRDVAAYALGVLDEADTFRFEDHLMECAGCSAQVTEFGPAARQLMLYRQATPRPVHPMAQPGPRLLDRLLEATAARHRRARRRMLYAVAASVVAALAGPALALMAGGGHGAVRVTATDERSGVWAQITTEDESWGSRLKLTVKDGAGPRTCRLVVIGRDGSEETVTSWQAQEHDARPDTVQGGAALHPGEIARYEVRTSDGEHLVTLQP
ncbi:MULTISPECIES: zf-HC2 domain-containing protein [unclassified Streptomyces]|uniref:zf-HC2 domain-containing protein n=1 Tax=unclassified Streptomyces TaxID=2593676 RepID=UPI001F03E4D6|nr:MULTISPECIES: zf-HC2 domain-containing protein [unclassified Streptomyces]MCH0564547.1 zf-HC2 domain-containing protein [Streptomyces sp. MUM 2J]MCH0572255.1 zf-HC2 domain-containing protein [Streptomyces sp. MUM 136J]